MKALILNSGMGTRMGALTSEHPKCMTEISEGETILSRQLRQLSDMEIRDVVITTGLFDKVLIDYCESLNLPLNYTFVNNPVYDTTNYIYSIYLAREHLRDDILLMHGDLVFEDMALDHVIRSEKSCMTVSSTAELPENDFKAVIENNQIIKVGIEFFDNAITAQPLYKLFKKDWNLWLDNIIAFCEEGKVSCYAENALNEVTDQCEVHPLDIEDMLCNEIDTPEDLVIIKQKLEEIKMKTVYMSFSTDIIHGGHISIINKAAKMGKLIVGVLCDEVVASYKRFPMLPYDERKQILDNVKGTYKTVPQTTLSYAENLRKYKPDYVVHGDDWKTGFQSKIRDEVIEVLNEYGGELIEFPYAEDDTYKALEQQSRERLSIPDIRRGRLKKLLEMKKTVSILEAHSGITGLIAETTTVLKDGKANQFDGMWVSSLCDSTA